MRSALIAAIATAVLCLGSADALARSSDSSRRPSGSSHHSGGHAGKSSGAQSGSHASTGKHGGTQKAAGVKRDANGKIERSAKAKDDFKKSHPCPSTGKHSGACPGYVIDHVRPLKRGGADSPSNMQWQTRDAAKSKDKTE
jgi:hypothetical protein